MDCMCIILGCYNVGNPVWFPDQKDDEPLYLCIIHLVGEGFCWCCGVQLKRSSRRKLCDNCYVPGESDEPFDNFPDLYDDGPIVVLKWRYRVRNRCRRYIHRVVQLYQASVASIGRAADP